MYSLGPVNHRVEIKLTSLEDGRTLPVADSRLGVPMLFLLDALITGATFDDAISVGGNLATNAGSRPPRGRWGAIVTAAGQSGATAVIVSPSAEVDLTDLMIAGEMSSLLNAQVIQLTEAEEVKSFLTGERNASVVEAMDLFQEVQGLTGRHDADDLMANLKVQERLTQIVNLMPNHLSAKLLLGYGREALPNRMSLRGSVRQINETVAPLRQLGKTDNTVVLEESQDDLCADSLFGLRRLRSSLAEGSLVYCDAAISFVELTREYLKLSNRTTNRAVQQAEEINAARAQMEDLRNGFKAVLEEL